MVGVWEVLSDLFQQVLCFKNLWTLESFVKLIKRYCLHSFHLDAYPREAVHHQIVYWRVFLRPLDQSIHKLNVDCICGMFRRVN